MNVHSVTIQRTLSKAFRRPRRVAGTPSAPETLLVEITFQNCVATAAAPALAAVGVAETIISIYRQLPQTQPMEPMEQMEPTGRCGGSRKRLPEIIGEPAAATHETVGAHVEQLLG
jgi:hypothetical protein